MPAPAPRACAEHPEAPVVAACTACGRWCCAACRVVAADGLAQCPACSAVDAPPHHPEIPAAARRSDEPEPEAVPAFAGVQAEAVHSAVVGPSTALAPIPWETDEASDRVALRRTIWAGLSRPMEFSARIPWAERDFYTPLVFALLCGTLGHVASVLQLAFSNEAVALPGAPAFAALGDLSPLSLGLLTLPVFPLMFTGLLFLSAFLAHACLSIVGAATRPFEATFRVVAYAHVGKVLLAVPLLGANVQVFYVVFLVLAGLRTAHGAGIGISVLALIPVVAAELMLG